MVVFESASVDDGEMNSATGSSRNLNLNTADSPTDSQRNTDGADGQQPSPTQPPSPPPLQQHSNLPQNSFSAGRPQHQLQPGSHSLSQAFANGARTMMTPHRSVGASIGRNGEVSGEGFRKDMRDLEELLSKLNPMAEEFVPSSLNSQSPRDGADGNAAYSHDLGAQQDINDSSNGGSNRNGSRRRRNNYSHGKQRMNTRTSMAQREEVIRKTVYVSDIDQQVTEEQLAALFINCGQVVDCRICGDPKSVLRFAFIEFTDEEGARAALGLSGTMLGYYPVRVLPSKTAIAPVNPTYLPRSEDELEMCTRTVYCTNIDKNVSQADVKLFFEAVCGEVYRLRLLGDYHHSTRIAFVEFIRAESAIAALNCSGVVLGSSPIRVSPSKTPVRPRASRQPVR